MIHPQEESFFGCGEVPFACRPAAGEPKHVHERQYSVAIVLSSQHWAVNIGNGCIDSLGPIFFQKGPTLCSPQHKQVNLPKLLLRILCVPVVT